MRLTYNTGVGISDNLISIVGKLANSAGFSFVQVNLYRKNGNKLYIV